MRTMTIRASALLALLLAAIAVGVAIGVPAGTARAAEPQPFARGSWAELQARHAGQPTVVHLWGLTCAPCLTELPHWADLQRERSDLRLVLLAADPVPQPPARVEEMLSRSGLEKLESWSFADRFNERLRYEIDPTWSGELPRTLLIDRDGKVTTLSGVADLGEVRAWLDRQGGRQDSPRPRN